MSVQPDGTPNGHAKGSLWRSYCAARRSCMHVVPAVLVMFACMHLKYAAADVGVVTMGHASCARIGVLCALHVLCVHVRVSRCLSFAENRDCFVATVVSTETMLCCPL